MSYWPVLIFWPAVVVGLMMAVFGVARLRVTSLVGGAMLMLPAALYLAATPRFRLVGIVPVVCVLLAAQAMRWNRQWLANSLVAGSTMFWSGVASVLVAPLVLHLLVAGTAVGVVASFPVTWKALIYVPAGIVAAFAGALLSFGDAPLLMRYPVLNPWTLSVLAAALAVTAIGCVDRHVLGPHRNTQN